MNEVKPCGNCQDHGVRLVALETDTKWMKGTLDEIRQHTKEVAEYAQQLVKVAHETATMSEAVSRAFEEIHREREERRIEYGKIVDDIAPVIRGWDGVVETSRWTKAGVVGIIGLVFVNILSMVIR